MTTSHTFSAADLAAMQHTLDNNLNRLRDTAQHLRLMEDLSQLASGNSAGHGLHDLEGLAIVFESIAVRINGIAQELGKLNCCLMHARNSAQRSHAEPMFG